jgi:hypothetical protein
MRTFNTTGPCRPDRHYMIPPLERSPTALSLVRGENYLAVSGPRQSGKTSLLKALVDGINADGWARAVLVSCEEAGQRTGVDTEAEAATRLVRSWHGAVVARFPDVGWPAVEPLLAMMHLAYAFHQDLFGLAFGNQPVDTFCHRL